jgi:hypothetical protein
MHPKKAQIEMKSVTHVYARFVTHVLARCREGESFERKPRMVHALCASGV